MIDEWGKGYAGAGGLLEKINYTNPQINPNEENTRLNSYIAYTKKFMTSSKLSYVGYFQPKFDTPSDYVSSHTVELNIPVYEHVSLSFTGKYAYDRIPPVGVEKKDTAYMTSLLWEF